MKIIQFTVCFLLAMFLCGFGCSSLKPTPDPLAGFHAASKNPDQIIEKDCQDYIKGLGLKPGNGNEYVAYIEFFEDGTGQHAEKITIFKNFTNWEHVLIYDNNNKRIKTTKYISGHDAS